MFAHEEETARVLRSPEAVGKTFGGVEIDNDDG
jgi:hypothetical protein